MAGSPQPIVAADPLGLGHVWRAPREGEPREEGGVCDLCGAFASEPPEPCLMGLADR